MATLDEVERSFRADPALADLLVALDRSAAAVAAACLSADDLLADLPAIRERVARETYGDAFMDELHRDYEALRAAGTLVVPASRVGLNVVVDVGHHDAYSVPREILPACARQLAGLPVLFVGVRCPLAVVMDRRRATWGVGTAANDVVPEAVRLWQQAVHVPGIYDLELDTSMLSAEECAAVIHQRLADGPPPTAFQRLAALATGEERAPT